MGGIIILSFFEQVQPQMAVAVKFHAFSGEGLEPFSPEVQTESPFGAVKFRSIELIVPDQSPFFVFGQKSVGVIFKYKSLHYDSPCFVWMW
jgi:hypothetical protein